MIIQSIIFKWVCVEGSRPIGTVTIYH